MSDCMCYKPEDRCSVASHKGAVVQGVAVSGDKTWLTISFYGDDPLVLEAVGDCCSSSWIEHLEMPADIDGATFYGEHKESDEVSAWDNHECRKCEHQEMWEEGDSGCKGGCGHDSLQVYNTRFPTSRGDIVVEYRNDSNGYYGGSLEC